MGVLLELRRVASQKFAIKAAVNNWERILRPGKITDIDHIAGAVPLETGHHESMIGENTSTDDVGDTKTGENRTDRRFDRCVGEYTNDGEEGENETSCTDDKSD